jgi:hypothetical protein
VKLEFKTNRKKWSPHIPSKINRFRNTVRNYQVLIQTWTKKAKSNSRDKVISWDQVKGVKKVKDQKPKKASTKIQL